MKLHLPADRVSSLLYRSTLHLGLPVLVVAWTIIAAVLATLVTAGLLTLLWGAAAWGSLALAAAVAAIGTPPLAYKIGPPMLELNRSPADLQRPALHDSPPRTHYPDHFITLR